MLKLAEVSEVRTASFIRAIIAQKTLNFLTLIQSFYKDGEVKLINTVRFSLLFP
jgi:hypothetical protein